VVRGKACSLGGKEGGVTNCGLPLGVIPSGGGRTSGETKMGLGHLREARWKSSPANKKAG